MKHAALHRAVIQASLVRARKKKTGPMGQFSEYKEGDTFCKRKEVSEDMINRMKILCWKLSLGLLPQEMNCME